MTRLMSHLSLSLVMLVVLAVALPQLYHLAFGVQVARTQLFYSPVRKAFVFREHRGDHNFTYADQHGDTFDRKTFETLIPFIYYKNMEIWGLMPLVLEGRSFDKQTIRANRQVIELKPREVGDRRPEIEVYPLLESNPGQARLRFPEDVFHATEDGLEFVNVDNLAREDGLTDRFTGALTAAGFRFPARLVAGKSTILKPFDEGYFLVDDGGTVFHLKRVDGEPRVVRTSIPSDLDIRHIKLSENKRKVFYGLLLAGEGRLFLISYDDYRLIPLPVDGYDPDSMDYKLLLNPLYPTAVFGNDETIHAVAMTPDFTSVDSYTRPVPGTRDMLHERIARTVFPFAINLEDPTSGYLSWRFRHHGWSGLAGSALALAVFLLLAKVRRTPWRSVWSGVVLTAFGGLFGLVAAFVMPRRR